MKKRKEVKKKVVSILKTFVIEFDSDFEYSYSFIFIIKVIMIIKNIKIFSFLVNYDIIINLISSNKVKRHTIPTQFILFIYIHKFMNSQDILINKKIVNKVHISKKNERASNSLNFL